MKDFNNKNWYTTHCQIDKEGKIIILINEENQPAKQGN